MTEKKTKIPFKYRFEFTILKSVEWLVNLFPDRAVRFIGRRLGDLLWWVFPYRLKVMVINLGIVFPEWNRTQILKKAHHLYRVFGEVTTTYFILHRPAMWQHIAETVDPDKALFDNLLKEGNGILFPTLHFGHWEALIAYWQMTDTPFTGIYKIQKNPLSDQYFIDRRNIFGHSLQLVNSRAGMDAFVENVKSNRVLMNAMDQSARKRGIQVQFFSEEYEAPRGTAKIKILSGAPVVFGFHCYENGKYFLHKKLLHLPDHREVTDENVKEIVEIILREAETAIRTYPDQWLWFHKLWKGKYHHSFRRKWFEYFL